MTTINSLRTTYLNTYLHRAEADTKPWTDAQCTQHLTDALVQVWPTLGLSATGTVATSSASQVYTIPASIQRVSRIDLEYSSGGTTRLIQKVTNWRYYSTTQVVVAPVFDTDATLALRFWGYKPFASTGADLPTNLENVIAMKAAALAYGGLAAELVNSQRQQNLDSGRVVDYQSAIGLSAYWERRYEEAAQNDPTRLSYAPRHAYR